LSLIPFGLGAWAPIYAGARVGNRRWSTLGAVWSVIAIAGWVLAIVKHGGAAGGLLIILGWAGAIATSFAIRAPYKQIVSSPFEAAVAGAERQLTERERGRQLARDRPELARRIGIGRPDVPNAQDAGLIDVNNAPAAVLARLPGVDDALATQIVEARAGIGGFESVEDLGLALDLDGHLVEAVRAHVVFLPR
jgi:Helix-hairpin-helix motif